MTPHRTFYIALSVIGFFALLIGALFWSAHSTPKPHPSTVAWVAHTIRERNGPEFRREYTAALPGERTLKIKCYSRYQYNGHAERLVWIAEITQADGKYVFFTPDKIAEKILDKALVPFIVELSDAILEEDRRWWEAKPSRFVDASGVVWERSLNCDGGCS